jgi:hypothetical protein
MLIKIISRPNERVEIPATKKKVEKYLFLFKIFFRVLVTGCQFV